MLRPLSYSNVLKATDSVDGQLCRDKEYPFSGITNLEEGVRQWCLECEGFPSQVDFTLMFSVRAHKCLNCAVIRTFVHPQHVSFKLCVK